MKTFDSDKFLNTFQAYFDLKVEKGRTTYYYGKKDLTIYYNTENYLTSNDLRIMVMDFKYTEQIENLSLFVRIPLDNGFNKANGMTINSGVIKNHIKKAKDYLPIFKQITKASYNGKPYLLIKCNVDQVHDERGILRHKISNVSYQFEISFNVKENGQSDSCTDYISYVDRHLDDYFSKTDVDVSGADYKRKLDLYSMIVIWMKKINFDIFSKSFQDYFGFNMSIGTAKHYDGPDRLIVIYEYNPSFLRRTGFTIKENNGLLKVYAEIPMDYTFNKNNPLILNGQEVQEKIDEAIHYFSVFRKIVDVDEYYKPYLNINFIIDEVTEGDEIVKYNISTVTYNFEMTYNSKVNGREDNSKNFLVVVQDYLDKYFQKNDIDVTGSSYKEKIDLYNMMEI